MAQKWIVVANQAGVRFFEQSLHKGPLTLVNERGFPEGGLRNQELESGRPGRTFSSSNEGGAFTKEVDAHTHQLQIFAKDISVAIEKGLDNKAFKELVLIAEPRFLGIMREAFSKRAHDAISTTIQKDLVHAKAEEVLQYL